MCVAKYFKNVQSSFINDSKNLKAIEIFIRRMDNLWYVHTQFMKKNEPLPSLTIQMNLTDIILHEKDRHERVYCVIPLI